MRLTALGSLLTLCALMGPLAVGADAPVAEKPKLGVALEDVPFDPSQGIPVRTVAPGSTAAMLGLQAGDAIKTLNGKPIAGFADLVAVVGALQVGDAVTVDVTRKGTPMTLSGKMLPGVTAASVGKELNEAQAELDKVKRAVDARTREPTLAELIRELQMLQEQFPKAAAEFKKLYPDGEFSIVIRITSDKNAANPVDLMKNTPPASGTTPPEGAATPAAPEAKASPAPVPTP